MPLTLTNETLMQVREGAISFNRFARDTRGEFRLLAGQVLAGMRRAGSWARQLDDSVVDDLVQEMQLEAFMEIGRWRPGPYPLRQFVVYRACQRARRWLGGEFKQARVMSEISASPTHEEAPPMQELEIEVVELLRDLPHSPRQAALLDAVFEAVSVDDALKQLLRDPATRKMFRGPRPNVIRGMYRTLNLLTARAADMA